MEKKQCILQIKAWIVSGSSQFLLWTSCQKIQIWCMKSSTKPKRSKRVGKWKFCQHSLTFFWRIQKKIFWRMLVTKPFFFVNIFLYIPQKKVRCWEGWGWVNYDRIFIFVWLVFNLQTCQITNMMHAWWKDPFIYFMLTWRWFSWWGWFSILNWTLEGTSYTRFFSAAITLFWPFDVLSAL